MFQGYYINLDKNEKRREALMRVTQFKPIQQLTEGSGHTDHTALYLDVLSFTLSDQWKAF